MKTMKNYLKVVLCFVAFAICSFLLAFSPTLTAQAVLDYTATSYNVAINAIKMPKAEVNVGEGEKLTIPLLEANQFNGGVADYTIRVMDPDGYPHEYVVKDGATNDTNYFNNSVAGEITVKNPTEGIYKIVYVVNETVGTGEDAKTTTYYSNVYSVTVVNSKYELDFSARTGDKAGLITLLPAEAAKGSTITLPTASVKEVASGNYLDTQVTRTVTGPVKEGDEVKIKTITIGSDNVLTATEAGTYTVKYEYSTGSIYLQKEFIIKVDANYIAPELVLMSGSKMPEVELGQTGITLPKPAFKAGNKENVEINVLKVRIEKETNPSIYCELTNNDLDFDMTVASFKNATSYEDLNNSNYSVIYYVQDANGKTAEEKFRITGVTIDSNPAIYMSYNYELDSDKKVVGEVDTNATTELKVRYGFEEIVAPAVYATDLITEYKDLKFVRILRNATTKQAFYVDNLMEDGTVVTAESHPFGYNYAEGIDANNPKYNNAVAFKFWDDEHTPTSEEKTQVAGTYYLEYKVISNNVKTRSTDLVVSGKTQYSFVVDGDHAVLPSTYTTAPKVELGGLKEGNYIYADTEFKVTVTASDEKIKDVADSQYTDARLKNAVFYYYGEVTNTLEADIKAAITSVRANAEFKNTQNVLDSQLFVQAMPASYTGFVKAEESDTKNSFIVNVEDATKQKATIIAVSLNDYNNIGVTSKTVNIKVTSGDELAPTYAIDTTGSSLTLDSSEVAKFAQGVDVVLPTVTFTDVDTALQRSVTYYVNSPVSKSAGLQYRYTTDPDYGAGINTIAGGTITTDEIGTYVVAYSAMDAAGNVTVVYISFEVYDSSKPILLVEAIGDGLTQSGSTITAVKGSTISFDAILKGSDYSELDKNGISTDVKVKANGKNLGFKASKYGVDSYEFLSVGSYTIIVNGSYTDANGTRVADEKRLEVVITAPKVEWNAVSNIQTYADTNTEVFLPALTTTYDGSYEVKPVVTTSTGATINPTKDSTSGRWKFTTNSTSGKYTITYSATFDDSGISIDDKVYTLKVGDMTSPTITMSADVEAKLKQDITYDGKNDIEYIIDLDKKDYTLNITAKSNGKTLYTYNTELAVSDDQTGKYSLWQNLKVTLTSKDGKVESGSESGQYLIKAKGNYTLTISAKDNVDNAAKDLTIDFKVVTKSSVATNSDTVVGIVLIVVSLVVLAGVILFFTLTGKKGGSKNSKKVKNAKTENSAEDIVVEEAPVEDKTEDKE